jgi:chemotaxis signal transduction protein
VSSGAVHVRLQLRSETYALSIESVLEVAELGELTTIPGSGAGLLGICNFHGQVLPVFDLGAIVGTPAEHQTTRLLVADHGGRLAGLVVDEITDVTPLTTGLADAESEFLTHSVLEEGRLVGVLDVDSLFAALARVAA